MQAFQHYVPAAMLAVIVIVAVSTDLRQGRIPNWLVVTALLSGLVLQSAASGLSGALSALAGASVGLAAMLPFYLLKGMGAGDVKLMAGVGAFFGPMAAALAVILTLLAGLVLVLLVLRTAALDFFTVTIRAQRVGSARAGGGRVIPYAPAIAAGSLAALWLTAV
jgi:prepilin peptidase CpaA